MKKFILILSLISGSISGFSQISDEKDKGSGQKNTPAPASNEKTVELEVEYIMPEHLNLMSFSIIPIHFEYARSVTNFGALFNATRVIDSKLVIDLTIGKSYWDEATSDNTPLASDADLSISHYNTPDDDWSLSIYKERTAFQWHGSVFYPLAKTSKELEHRITFKQVGNVSYVTDVPSKKQTTYGPRLGMGYWAGHVDNVSRTLEGIQVSDGYVKPYRDAARTQIDYTYFSLGIAATAFQNSSYKFTKYGRKTIKRLGLMYLDYMRAVTYHIDNIIMMDTQVPNWPKVEYNLQDLTPFKKNGVRLGLKGINNSGGIMTTTLGAELGIRPGINTDVYYWIYGGFGFNISK